MEENKKHAYMVKGVIAAIIACIVAYYAISRYNELKSPVKNIEELLNEGVAFSDDNNYDAGLKIIEKAITLAHRKAQTTTSNELKEKLIDIEAQGLLLKAVFIIRKTQNKYSKERYISVVNDKTFRLPAEELKKAEEALLQVIELKPIKAEAYRLLGYIYREKGQYMKAIEMLEHAIEQRENFAEALNDLGEAYYMIKQYDKAREFYEKAIIADDKLASAHLNLGMFYYYQNKALENEKSSSKAAKHLQEFVKLGKDSGFKEDIIKAQELLADLGKIPEEQ